MKKKNRIAAAFKVGMDRGIENASKDIETTDEGPKGNWSLMARRARENAQREDESEGST